MTEPTAPALWQHLVQWQPATAAALAQHIRALPDDWPLRVFGVGRPDAAVALPPGAIGGQFPDRVPEIAPYDAIAPLDDCPACQEAEGNCRFHEGYAAGHHEQSQVMRDAVKIRPDIGLQEFMRWRADVEEAEDQGEEPPVLPAASAVVSPPPDRAAVLLDAAAECNKAGGAYAERGADAAAGAAFALMETFLRQAGEAEFAATPCSAPNVCMDGDDPCDAHERVLGHIEGDHDLCAPDCGQEWLRRLAAEAAVTPPPALTEEGRLRAQVEVLQQDAERDRGLAKVGARCMRVGHQGLIERGRIVLEGWRFALSTALDLGTGAPWEAIHERVKELAAEAQQQADTETPEVVALHQQVKRLGLMVDEYGAGASALTDKLKRVRDLHRETCPVAQAAVSPTAFKCGLCEVLDAPAPVVQQPAAADGEGTPFGVDGCLCKPWTTEDGKRRFLKPGETVDRVSGWHVNANCPHHKSTEEPRP